jgi:hypothetical protein
MCEDSSECSLSPSNALLFLSRFWTVGGEKCGINLATAGAEQDVPCTNLGAILLPCSAKFATALGRKEHILTEERSQAMRTMMDVEP